jgi:hypothetical protein
MPSIARFSEQGKREERTFFEKTHCWRTPIYRFPDTVKEAIEAAKCLAEIDVDVLSFTGSISPDRRGRNGFGSQANGSHSAKTDWAWHNRILSVESQLASGVRCCHPNLLQHFIHARMQVES